MSDMYPVGPTSSGPSDNEEYQYHPEPLAIGGGFNNTGERRDRISVMPTYMLAPFTIHTGDGAEPRRGHNSGGTVTATSELAAIMSTASTPATPGSSSPQLEQSSRSHEFVPPMRPSSTPFPDAQRRQADIQCMTCQPESAFANDCETSSPVGPVINQHRSLKVIDLPVEIHECILDHLFGFRLSTSSQAIPSLNSCNHSMAMRHSRRKELSNLALVMPIWRDLVHARLYRHIKLKATIDGDNEVAMFFSQHLHLRLYVKHIEIWFPVFEPKSRNATPHSTRGLPVVSPEGIASATYGAPSRNSTLDEVFYMIANVFPEAGVLTLEGGERKKAPQVIFGSIPQSHERKMLPTITSVRTLIIKGQWNIIREPLDWKMIQTALPALEEWHGMYARPKSKSYLSMAGSLDVLSPQITKLNLCLESDYRREITCPSYYLKVCAQLHWCEKLAKAASRLEHLSYTGRVCHGFFDHLARYSTRTSRLRTIDITVKNCCRPRAPWNESGSGITYMHFIHAFERLVLSGIRALARLTSVNVLRIRYVDLDSPVPPLNPYFVIRDGWCSGVWSDEIVSELKRVRPNARFESLADTFGEVCYNKDGRLCISPDFPKSRVLSLKLSNYAMLAPGGITAL